MQPNDIECLIAAALEEHPDRWSNAAIVFALGTYEGGEGLEEYLDEIERRLADPPRDRRASLPDPPPSSLRLRRR